MYVIVLNKKKHAFVFKYLVMDFFGEIKFLKDILHSCLLSSCSSCSALYRAQSVTFFCTLRLTQTTSTVVVNG